jgi:hypothetical protein
VVSWFSGRSLDTVLPINVSIATVATDSKGRPTEFVGASWSGYGLIPLQVTISIGELLMGSGTPQMFARYLLVSEVTEMYMRGMATLGLSQWFGNLDEGNKGEALSDFLATQFLLKNFPGVTSLPTVLSGSTRVTNLWLNSARDNFLEVADDDNVPNTKIGCCALFLFYLHDQLGYRIEDIINKGAHALSEVYAQLTGEAAANAWIKFSTLVNTHYPNSRNASGNFTPRYNPMLETIFPVVDLVAVSDTPSDLGLTEPAGVERSARRSGSNPADDRHRERSPGNYSSSDRDRTRSASFGGHALHGNTAARRVLVESGNADGVLCGDPAECAGDGLQSEYRRHARAGDRRRSVRRSVPAIVCGRHLADLRSEQPVHLRRPVRPVVFVVCDWNIA